MALSRKGSRRMIVGGRPYRWSIRKKATRTQAEYEGGTLHVAIEPEGSSGRKLLVRTVRPHPKNALTGVASSIRPSDVRAWIEESIRRGWMPAARAVTTVYEDADGALHLDRPVTARRNPPRQT